MKNKLKAALYLSLVLSAGGCDSSTDSTIAFSFFPLKTGNKWHYNVESRIPDVKARIWEVINEKEIAKKPIIELPLK